MWQHIVIENISNQSIPRNMYVYTNCSGHPPQAITSFWIVVVAYWAPLYSQASKIYIIIYTPLCIYNLSSHLIVGVVDCCMPIKILLSYPISAVALRWLIVVCISCSLFIRLIELQLFVHGVDCCMPIKIMLPCPQCHQLNDGTTNGTTPCVDGWLLCVPLRWSRTPIARIQCSTLNVRW